jgi:hypothetical protein
LYTWKRIVPERTTTWTRCVFASAKSNRDFVSCLYSPREGRIHLGIPRYFLDNKLFFVNVKRAACCGETRRALNPSVRYIIPIKPKCGKSVARARAIARKREKREGENTLALSRRLIELERGRTRSRRHEQQHEYGPPAAYLLDPRTRKGHGRTGSEPRGRLPVKVNDLTEAKRERRDRPGVRVTYPPPAGLRTRIGPGP